VDEARGRAVFPDRDLAQHQRSGTCGLQDGEDVAHPRIEAVDLVQEQEAGNAAVFELLQDELQRRNALGIGLAHHDSSIAARERERALMLKFDGTRAIDEGEAVAEEAHIGDVELNAHAMVASFLARIAHRVPVGDPALARYGARTTKDNFQNCRLAGGIRPNQWDAAGAAAGWAGGLSHGVLLEIGSGKGTPSPRAPTRLSFRGA